MTVSVSGSFEKDIQIRINDTVLTDPVSARRYIRFLQELSTAIWGVEVSPPAPAGGDPSFRYPSVLEDASTVRIVYDGERYAGVLTPDFQTIGRISPASRYVFTFRLSDVGMELYKVNGSGHDDEIVALILKKRDVS